MGNGYLKYILKARGRHGTHSPFVYAFVEQVLRKKQHFPYLSKNEICTIREQELLCKTIAFLKTKSIVFVQKEITPLKGIFETAFPEIKYFFLSGLKGFVPQEDTLIILAPEFLKHQELMVFKNIKGQNNFGIYYLHPYQNKATALIWAKSEDWLHYPMSLDFRKGGLLMQDIAFKQKQHFLLK